MKLCPKCQKQFSDDANFCPVDAARLVPLVAQAPSAPVDALAQRFQIGEPLGGHRTGAVYRAVDLQTGAAAAVKVIAPAVLALPGVAQRIERELKQLERVHSAGVARVLASGRRGEEWWIGYELVPNAQTLAESIASHGPIPLDHAAHLVEVVGEALIEAAQVGVVHRDLAPKNVLFAGQDIKLINFSVPVPTSERAPGVPEFVAPEQVEGKPVDQRSNLYSLGALYYYVLTGQPVHAGAPNEVHQAHVNGSIRTPSSLAPVPAAVEAVIMRALDKSPTKRFLTVRQFVDEVGRVARGESSGPRTTQPMGKVGRPKAELVQTLLGVRSGPTHVPLGAVAHPPSTMPGVGSGPANVGSGPAPMPGSAPGSAPVMPMPVMPMPVPLQPVPVQPSSMQPSPMQPSPERSPWAPPAAEQAPLMPEPQSQPAILVPQAAVPASQPVAVPASQPVAVPAPQPQPVSAPQPVPIPVPMAAPPSAPVAAPQPQPQPQPIPAPVPVPAPPQVAAPQVAAAAVKKPKSGEAESRGKFRETMWFKKGEVDAQAAQIAAEERARTGKDVAGDKADSLPMEERYKDDGSLSRGDKEKYSLRTGSTQMMPTIDPQAQSSTKVSEDTLIGEMKRGRGKALALIALGIIALIIVLVIATR